MLQHSLFHCHVWVPKGLMGTCRQTQISWTNRGHDLSNRICTILEQHGVTWICSNHWTKQFLMTTFAPISSDEYAITKWCSVHRNSSQPANQLGPGPGYPGRWCHHLGPWVPRIVLMGGNYVFKATPYYPPLDVVRKNAKAMAEGGWFFLSRWVSFAPSGVWRCAKITILGRMMNPWQKSVHHFRFNLGFFRFSFTKQCGLWSLQTWRAQNWVNSRNK